MDFSDSYKQSNGLVCWSPDGKYLASSSMHRCIVRDAESLQVVQIWMCLDQIEYIEWSPDSKFIMCAIYKRALIQVWSIEEREWTCKIDEGPAGLSNATWAPDGLHIMSTSDFQLRITVWSLLDKSAKYFKYPKYSDRGMAFSHDGRYLAILNRRDCKDGLTLIECESERKWQAVNYFSLDTQDAADVIWAPDDGSLVVWDSPMQYNCLHIALDGHVLGSYSAYDDALGIKCVEWSPTSDYVAIGSFDGQVRILNALSWKVVTNFVHTPTISPPTSAVIYEEEENPYSLIRADNDNDDVVVRGVDDNDAGESMLTRARYAIAKLPTTIPTLTPEPDKINPHIGVGFVRWSPDGSYLAVRCDNMPNALWIWNVKTLSLSALLIQLCPIRQARWCSSSPSRLALCTANARVYLWNPAGCSVVDCPTAEFSVQKLLWRADGSAVLLSEKTRYCAAWALSEGEEEEEADSH